MLRDRWLAALLKAANKGAYTYYDNTSDAGREGNWDNSNSQYGLLGVWSGAEADIIIPSSYWTEVEKHWTKCQAPGGQWSYRQTNSPRLTMTCAGIASLFVCHDWLDATRSGTAVGRPPMSAALKKALDWLEDGNNSINVGGDEWGYTLYGVERVGLASGYKFFGKHNWYPELAAQILSTRCGDHGGIVGSRDRYGLMHCSSCRRGRHPVLMNKLRYDGYWANRPRDIANLATYASRENGEWPLNWQVVSIECHWTDWSDSPIF